MTGVQTCALPILTAINTDTVENLAIAGAAAGAVAVPLSGSVNTTDTTTRAIIGTGAQINQDTSGVDASQAVHVAAGNDFYHIGVAGSAGVSGTAAVGVGLQIALVKHTTEAQINGKVNAAGDITVRAHGADKIVCVAIGFAASGLVGVGGSVGVNTFSNTTRASIGANAEALAGGSVIVKASDDSSGLVIAGAAGIGIGAAGVGISVAVTKFDKTTEAFIGNGAKVTALGGGSGASALTGLDNGTGFNTGTATGVLVQEIGRAHV